MNLKPIIPSLKEKKRYISFEVISSEKLTAELVSSAITKSSLDFLGTLDAGKAGLLVLNDKFSNNTGVVKISHKYVDKIRTSMMLVNKIGNQDVMFRTKIVSGTLKKTMKKSQEV
jgi:ribonuclease P/MRP protein subunit POP5